MSHPKVSVAGAVQAIVAPVVVIILTATFIGAILQTGASHLTAFA